jgi:hypothetical protein
MDVKYRPEPWQDMGDGMNRITKDALMKLREANELLKRIDGRIRDLDSDGSIHFNPKDQSQKIGELLDSYSTLQKYCGEAGRVVSEHIDKPFLVEMDKFAQKMRDTSILSFETNNRIGSTTTTVLPDAHAGYGSIPQTIQTKKDKITVEDIFKDSPAFDNVLRGEYKELKKQNPDAKLNYEEYKKVVPSTRGFEYKSIEDEQKKLEMVRDIGIGVGIIITTILCPPLGTAAAVVYGAVQIKNGIDGEDWGTHRKLSQEERVGNVIFGGLDAIPVVGVVGKGVKAFKGTNELADLAKLLKFKEGMPGFNPNLGKNVVQSLKENKTLKNALDVMKNTNIPVAVRVADTGMGVKLPYIEYSTVGEVAGKFSKVSTTAKDDAYQLAKGSGGSGVSKEGSVAKGTGNTSKAVDDVAKDGSHFSDEFKLKPNVKYETNGYLYQTDELGRIERASGELTLEMGERNSKHQLAAGGEDRVKAPSTQGDHGGHLIGTQFNGSPLIDNIVAMNGNVNVSAYKKLESAWAKALRDKREVIVDIRPVYEGNSVRPVSFNIKYRIDGEKFKASLKNVYGGK